MSHWHKKISLFFLRPVIERLRDCCVVTEHIAGTLERQLEKLRRDFGDLFLGALADPETVEILLNPDGTLWQERLGENPVQIGSMSAVKRVFFFIRRVTNCLRGS